MALKKKILLIATVIAVFATVALVAGGQKEHVYEVGFGHGFMPDSVHHTAALAFKEEVESKSNGRVKISIFHSGQLGSAREMFEGLQMGSLDITLVPTARISGFAPQLQIFDLPFLFPSAEVRNTILDGPIGQELLDTLKNQQVVGIGFYDDGYKQITGNKPLIAPADFKGLKFRTMESAIIMEQYRALGADPVPIDYAEVYSALQMGVVDGHENPIVLISDMKFHEVQQYIMISNHAFLGGVLLYASSWFSKLPEDLQQIFVDAGQSMVKRQRQGVAQIEADLLKDIAATGTHIIELTDAQKEALRLATLPVHEIYRKEFGGAILDKIYAEVEKLSK